MKAFWFIWFILFAVVIIGGCAKGPAKANIDWEDNAPVPPYVGQEPSPTSPPMPTVTEFFSAPRNPRTPEEIGAAFFFLLSEEKYTEANDLVGERGITEPELKQIIRPGTVKSIKIDPQKGGIDSKAAALYFIINLGGSRTLDWKLFFFKEADGWKINPRAI